MDAYLEQELRAAYDLGYRFANALEDAARALVGAQDRQRAYQLHATARRLADAVLAFGDGDVKKADSLHRKAEESLTAIYNHAGKGQGALSGAPTASGQFSSRQEAEKGARGHGQSISEPDADLR